MILSPLTYTISKLNEYEDRKNSEIVLSQLKKLSTEQDCTPLSDFGPMYPTLTPYK